MIDARKLSRRGVHSFIYKASSAEGPELRRGRDRDGCGSDVAWEQEHIRVLAGDSWLAASRFAVELCDIVSHYVLQHDAHGWWALAMGID